MIRKICIIGLGSLGGFLAKHLSENDKVNELVLVDFDIVERKNVGKSIYNFNHIGELKVNALEKIINENHITITKKFTKYIEGTTWIPACDLIIDCRDYVYNRNGEINIRLYISGKTIVLDCRKIVNNQKQYAGHYSISLSKNEINKAAFIASQIITNSEIKNLCKNEITYRENINLFNDSIDKSIEDNLKNKMDMIYESNDCINRVQCLEDNINPILKANEFNDLPLYMDDKKQSIPVDIFFKGMLKEPQDLLNSLYQILQSNKISNFMIILKETRHGKKYIELLEETGAA